MFLLYLSLIYCNIYLLIIMCSWQNKKSHVKLAGERYAQYCMRRVSMEREYPSRHVYYITIIII